ncbi:16S rRNA (cytidine(1402)-2'-O)-methyltransferase [Aliidiomarina minuta]|uniref:Ribosomal RNA small subunit methyltransferase I n=1 Tax=Aliidiomarina minuta TaxID=880057 RepID=A0A432W8Z9_9GAMM|nr:16S rRNA (cytidine(1402)-2'-O)-methyltransferase [Aliidiomarina minuta]RUO26630.1 16S rRNA (cytidine(1402)-2'-O)-methyltransferase [Aliidiomarina minuta]
MLQAGTLYIVPTPIGNLADITLRAIEVLQSVDRIVAEDTRHSQGLLQHHGIQKPLSALHEHNERQRIEYILKLLKAGEKIALISDAGTPLISDPGFPLVRACREEGAQVVPLPGPCAAIAALSAAGLPTDRFLFAGFSPAKNSARETFLRALQNETGTILLYESPRRVLDSLKSIQAVMGAEREVVIARELTKQFETFLSGPVSEVIAKVETDSNQQRGEIVLMIKGFEVDPDAIPTAAAQLLKELSEHLPVKKAAALVATHYGLRKNKLYQLALTWNSDEE